MAVRAADRVTLAVLPAPSYVRTYYLTQESTLGAPAKPTTNPPAAPWTTTEPAYTAGSTLTLYTAMVTVYGSVAFDWGDVQKSSSYEAAKQAYNLAASKANVPTRSTSAASGPGKNGDLWEQWSSLAAGGKLLKFWRHNGTSWILGEIDPTYLPAVSIGEGTFGQLTGGRIDMASFWADEGNIGVLEAGIISADWLMPNVGDSLNLSANDSIEMIVGRQDVQDVAIEHAQQAADAADGKAVEADEKAATAAAAAATAAGAALVAQARADSLGDELAAQQAVFRVTSTGGEVATLDGANVLRLTPDGVQIMQGGTPVSTWDAGRFISNQAILATAQVAGHSIEKVSAGRTVFKPLS